LVETQNSLALWLSQAFLAPGLYFSVGVMKR
jgi:hypothetical protein